MEETEYIDWNSNVGVNNYWNIILTKKCIDLFPSSTLQNVKKEERD